jgi:hypothetical protein
MMPRVRPTRNLKRSLHNTYRTTRFVVRHAVSKLDVPSVPFLDPAGLKYFETAIPNTSCYLEFGSGGSTVFARRFVDCLVSVESDKRFARAVEAALEADPSRAEVIVIPVNIGLTEEWGRPVFKTPTARRILRWQAYPKAPWKLLSDRGIQPDFVFIDGRFRLACALETLLNLRPDNSCPLVMDDYESRPHYTAVEQFADLAEMHGRMGVFRKKSGMDADGCKRLLEAAYADFR